MILCLVQAVLTIKLNGLSLQYSRNKQAFSYLHTVGIEFIIFINLEKQKHLWIFFRKFYLEITVRNNMTLYCFLELRVWFICFVFLD